MTVWQMPRISLSRGYMIGVLGSRLRSSHRHMPLPACLCIAFDLMTAGTRDLICPAGTVATTWPFAHWLWCTQTRMLLYCHIPIRHKKKKKNSAWKYNALPSNPSRKPREVDWVIAQVNKLFLCRRDRSPPHLLFARWKIAQSDRSMFVREHLCLWVLFAVRMSGLCKPQRSCGNTKTVA